MTAKTGIVLKALDGAGRGLARIATLSAVDSEGDTYAPGAFGNQWAQILPAHDWESAPLGKARVYEQGDDALAELHFNLGSRAGREWHAALSFDLDAARSGGPALQEWSYGFDVLASKPARRDGARVRLIERLKVHEVSPVVRGAGVNTATLALKRPSPRVDFRAGLAAAEAVLAAGGSAKAETRRLLASFLRAQAAGAGR